MTLLVLFLHLVKIKEVQCFVPYAWLPVGLRSDYKKPRFGQIQSLHATHE
jgi:hypothetical protein